MDGNQSFLEFALFEPAFVRWALLTVGLPRQFSQDWCQFLAYIDLLLMVLTEHKSTIQRFYQWFIFNYSRGKKLADQFDPGGHLPVSESPTMECLNCVDDVRAGSF